MKIFKYIFILLLLIQFEVFSQKLVKGEYFFDSDPGIGNGIAIDFADQDTVELLNIEVDISDLTNGYHKIFFRFMDENGLWSYNQQRLFFKGNLAGAGENQESAPLVKGEYFFNSDPGVGNGVKVDFTKGDTITLSDLNAPLDSLNGGYNKVFFRFMDENGLWSYNQQRLFFKGNLAGAGQNQELAEELSIYPNPFEESTTITYVLREDSNIELKLFDLLGNEVMIIDQGFVKRGLKKYKIDGESLISGSYFVILKKENSIIAKKVLYLK